MKHIENDLEYALKRNNKRKKSSLQLKYRHAHIKIIHQKSLRNRNVFTHFMHAHAHSHSTLFHFFYSRWPKNLQCPFICWTTIIIISVFGNKRNLRNIRRCATDQSTMTANKTNDWSGIKNLFTNAQIVYLFNVYTCTTECTSNICILYIQNACHYKRRERERGRPRRWFKMTMLNTWHTIKTTKMPTERINSATTWT